MIHKEWPKNQIRTYWMQWGICRSLFSAMAVVSWCRLHYCLLEILFPVTTKWISVQEILVLSTDLEWLLPGLLQLQCHLVFTVVFAIYGFLPLWVPHLLTSYLLWRNSQPHGTHVCPPQSGCRTGTAQHQSTKSCGPGTTWQLDTGSGSKPVVNF